MKSSLFSLSGAKALMMSAVLCGVCVPVSAAALFTLRGTTPEVKLELESELRLSVLGWTEEEQAKAVAEEFRRYEQSQDHVAFQNFLLSQETKGYLFTKEAAGHSIKYAWQEINGDDKRMVLLVMPALKTRNPYMWKTRNDDPTPFSLLELRFDGEEEAVMKTSLGSSVTVNAENRLELQDYQAAPKFATLRDDAPGYVKAAE
jgi:hypothetical protein